MSWYRVRLSLDDITTGRHIRLQNRFETLFLRRQKPAGAAMFTNSDAQNDYTYYFSPPCAVFLPGLAAEFGASACAQPVREEMTRKRN